MTEQERQMLTDLANKIAQTPAPAHEPEAEEFIRTRIGSRPDALYLMTQTVLIQNMALDHAKQQIQELQQRVAQGPAAATPTGSSFAGGQQRSPGSAPAPPPAPAYEPPQSGGVSSFLRSAATTAAGVAAGALAFEGIRSLFGGIGSLAGFGGGMHSSFLGNAPGSETIINNYYDSPDQSARDDANYDDSDSRDSDAQDTDTQDTDDSDDQSVDDVADDSDGSDDSSSGGDWV